MSAIFKLTYGLFVLSAKDGEKDNACIINTALQVTSNPLQVSVTVVQHIYDTHFEGVEEVEARAAAWERLEGRVPADVDARVRALLAEQLRSAREWRDQVNTSFLRRSGIPDERGRTIFP